jgi:replicative DNA helicase
VNEQDYASCEKYVLGTVVGVMSAGEDDKIYVMEGLERFGVRPDWFRDKALAEFYRAVEAYWKREHTLDPFMVGREYGADKSRMYNNVIISLAEVSTVLSNFDYYLMALKQKHIYGQAHSLMMVTMKEMTPDNVGIQLEDFVRKIHALQEDCAAGDNALKQLGDYMEVSLARKEKLHEERFKNHNWEYIDGLRMPWKEIDQIFSGLKTGLHIIAALASQGKSAMAVNISVFWNSIGIKHGFFSIDMAADQLADRYPCVQNRVSLAKLNFGGSKNDVDAFREGFEKCIAYNNVWLSEVEEAKKMEYQCYRGVKTLGWKAIIVDYIQLVHIADEGNVPEYTRVQHAVQALKNVAKKLKVPIICLAQLSRAFETQLREKGFAPGLDAIGDSAEIARAAASVTCIYQDEGMKQYWAENPPAMLAFADPADKAWHYGISRAADEDEKTTLERRTGQLSLARQLRPVWFDVKKNQQGRCGKVPFVMFPNYFLFRPGNSEGEKESVMVGGKSKTLPTGMFQQIRDDWTYTEQDWWLEMTGAMPQRGCKLMGETYEQMRERMARERVAHPEVAHFVNGEKWEKGIGKRE